MRLIATPIDGLWVAETDFNEDARGSFARIFCDDELRGASNNFNIAQINISKTHHVGTIRGMHFQYPPYSEIKMVRCIRGKVFDVVVDVRKNSETFLNWYGETLSEENWRMMVIPEGFAHGFQVMEENSELLYLHSHAYVPDSEGALRYDEPRVKIQWPLSVGAVSERDANHAYLDNSFQGIQF